MRANTALVSRRPGIARDGHDALEPHLLRVRTTAAPVSGSTCPSTASQYRAGTSSTFGVTPRVRSNPAAHSACSRSCRR